MPALPNDYKAAMRRFATGVTIVTTMTDDTAHGLTANAFASATADPPMLLICVNRSSNSHRQIAIAGFFCVNILTLEQRSVAERFARPATEDRFSGLRWHKGTTGAPIIDGALAYFDCTLAEEHTAGTHTVFLGDVVDCGWANGSPLGYFDGGYRDFGCIAD